MEICNDTPYVLYIIDICTNKTICFSQSSFKIFADFTMEALSALVSLVVFAFVRELTVGLFEYKFLLITHSITQKESTRHFKSIYFTYNL